MATKMKNRIKDEIDANGEIVTTQKPKAEESQHIQIAPPNIQVVAFNVVGTSPLVQNKFSHKSRQKMHETHAAGSTDKKGKKRAPRDFRADYEAAQHKSEDGWNGIPAASFRASMISACRTAGFKMTHARQTVFVLADGIDGDDGTALVRIKGKPQYFESAVRNSTGVADLRARPMFREWSCVVRVEFDADIFTVQDLANLLARAGIQVGVGEGRPGSKASNGMGWGRFAIEIGGQPTG